MLTPEALPLELFKYELPDSLIAHYPVEPADSCRLLVAAREKTAAKHLIFNQLPELLREGDLLVVNQTKVIPARVVGVKPTGGQVELLFERPVDGPIHEAKQWRCMGKPGKALRAGKTRKDVQLQREGVKYLDDMVQPKRTVGEHRGRLFPISLSLCLSLSPLSLLPL